MISPQVVPAVTLLCWDYLLLRTMRTAEKEFERSLQKRMKENKDWKMRSKKIEGEKPQDGKGSKDVKVSGDPGPEDMEVAAEVATGGEAPKRQVSKPDSAQDAKKKKSSTTVNDLYHDEEDVERPQVVSTEVSTIPPVQAGPSPGASGSAAPGSDLSHQQFWSPVIPGGALAESAGGAPTSDANMEQTNALLKTLAEAYEIGNLQAVPVPEHKAIAADLNALGLKREDAEASQGKEKNSRFFGLPIGYVLELEAKKSSGEAWNLEKDLQTLQATLVRENTYLLVGDSSKTLDATVDLYSLQSERGKCFLREQVGDKSRKQTKKVERFLSGNNVYKVHAECKLHEENGYRRNQ